MANRALLEVMLILRNDSRFSAFKDWVAAEKAAAVRYLTMSNDDRAVAVAQGDVRRLTQIEELLEQAPNLLEKAARQ